MRIRILSDLHIESGPFMPPRVDADVVVLAGDISQGLDSVGWVKRTFSTAEEFMEIK